jgi:hypothetical protein
MNGPWSPAVWREAWRKAPVPCTLVAVVTVGVAVAAIWSSAFPWVMGPGLLLLDAAGAWYSWRAAAFSPTGLTPWRMVAAGRAASVLTTIGLSASAMGAPTSWWWIGTLMRLVMFLLLAMGVLISGIKQYTGRSRRALLAEIVMVIAAGFMVVWYFTLDPIIRTQEPSTAWIATVGWPLGDLLLLTAVTSVVLRGAVTRFAAPIAIFAAGLATYFAADVAWSAIGPPGAQTPDSPAITLVMLVASLLMTVAPMVTSDTQEGSAVTEAIIRLAQILHLSTVAEGIESEQQAADLLTLGCDTGQGYLFAKPLSADALAQFTMSTEPRA